MENILITGGCGFIGSHFARLLITSGYSPVILDKMTYAADIKRLEKRFEEEKSLYIRNIKDKKIEHIIKDNDISIIVNFAAETDVDRSIIDSHQFVYSNIVGVHNLLEISRHYNLRFVQISTDEVYGNIKEGSFRETDILNPSNPYSASKASADLLVLSYYKTYGLDISITRSTNNYGPWQHSEKFIPRMIYLAMQNKPLQLYGEGNNIRDWLYVEDNCRAIKLVMESGTKGDIYNIGSGNELTNNWVANMISKRFNVSIQYITDRLGHDFRYSLDCSKIKKEFDWKPIIKFDDGLEYTIKHFLIKDSI